MCGLYLLLASIPVMELAPSNLTVLDGKDATIPCKAAGAPTPNITWYFNGMDHVYFLNIDII